MPVGTLAVVFVSRSRVVVSPEGASAAVDRASGLEPDMIVITKTAAVQSVAPALEVVPLGGLGEFGLNMMAISWG